MGIALQLLVACASTDPIARPADTAIAEDSAVVTETGDSAGEPAVETGEGDTSRDTVESAPPDTSQDSAPPDTAQDTAPAGDLVIYAVRHCEKESEGEDPGLTEEGQARAEALAVVMEPVPLVAIYATELARTQETVAPTAEDHGLTVVTDIDPEDDLAAHVLATHAEETILHAGHSYTLPDFFEALGIADVPDVDDYGQLWIVTVTADGEITVEESSFGE